VLVDLSASSLFAFFSDNRAFKSNLATQFACDEVISDSHRLTFTALSSSSSSSSSSTSSVLTSWSSSCSAICNRNLRSYHFMPNSPCSLSQSSSLPSPQSWSSPDSTTRYTCDFIICADSVQSTDASALSFSLALSGPVQVVGHQGGLDHRRRPSFDFGRSVRPSLAPSATFRQPITAFLFPHHFSLSSPPPPPLQPTSTSPARDLHTASSSFFLSLYTSICLNALSFVPSSASQSSSSRHTKHHHFSIRH
jgi:hypothetical protein